MHHDLLYLFTVNVLDTHVHRCKNTYFYIMPHFHATEWRNQMNIPAVMRKLSAITLAVIIMAESFLPKKKKEIIQSDRREIIQLP